LHVRESAQPHSSLDVTDRVYGHMEAATRQREAREMAGVFGV
jgi:hypothetical protein